MEIPAQLNFNSIEERVFTEIKGKIYIGKEEIKPELLDILREQARYLSTSQLYEVLLATLKNEASNLALIQSKDWESVQAAKMLWHCAYVIENMVEGLKAK